MKVLLGIGGSDDSLHALHATVERAQRAGDDLTVAVVENPESDRTTEEVEEQVQTVLDEAGLDAPIRHISGHAGSELVDLAESEGFELIVLGGGQQSPMGKIQIGHIAEFVLLNAQTSVTLIR